MVPKKILLTISILVILICAVTTSGCLQEGKIYKAGVSPTYYPLSELNYDTEVFSGLDIEILNRIAKDQNIIFEFVPMYVSGYKEAMENDIIDLMSAMTIVDERKETVNYSIPYLTNDFQIVAKKISNVTLDDVISGKAVLSTQMGSAQEMWIINKIGQEEFDKRVNEGKIIRSYSVYGALKDVTTTTADAIILSGNIVSGILEQYTTLQAVAATKEETYAAYGISKDETELLEKINKGLQNLISSGELNELKREFNIAAKKDLYKIGVDVSYEPFVYLDNTGNLTGYDIDSVKWIAENQGFDVEFVPLRFSEYENAINTGIIDAWYCYLTESESRMKAVTFTDPYYHSVNLVVALSENNVTKEKFSADELRTGVITGSLNSKWIGQYFFDNYDDMVLAGKIAYFNKHDELLTALHEGTVDTIIFPRVFINSEIESGEYKVIEELSKGNAVAAVKNGDVFLIEMLNDGIANFFAANQDDVLKEKYNLRRAHV